MHFLEAVSTHIYGAYFVDLFVRASNALAISMYRALGYVIYRQVLEYYSGEEDAYGESSTNSLVDRQCMYKFCF
jgi:N-terminal acetyltransferase B complex catalytic subunit